MLSLHKITFMRSFWEANQTPHRCFHRRCGLNFLLMATRFHLIERTWHAIKLDVSLLVAKKLSK